MILQKLPSIYNPVGFISAITVIGKMIYRDVCEPKVAWDSEISEWIKTNLLDETKGFKNQITVKVLLKKYKGTEIEYSPVYFNSTTKTVMNHKFDLDKSFREILKRIDNWISEGYGWIVKSINSQYINISTYRSLIGSSYVTLSVELRNPKKELINIKNNDQKCFCWFHIRHNNPVKYLQN